MKTEELIQAASEILSDESIYADVYEQEPFICVDIRWGDWKHSHLRADILLMDKLGLECVTRDVTEENGSDCYSAIHYYV